MPIAKTTPARSAKRRAPVPARIQAGLAKSTPADAVNTGAIDTSFLKTLVGYNARRAALVIIDTFLREMAVYGFKAVDFSVMSVIQHNPGVTSRQLCAVLSILPPNLVGLVQTLEQRGLIERRPHPSDGRAIGLHATPAGTQLMVLAERQAQALETASTAKLSEPERQTLMRLLQAIYD